MDYKIDYELTVKVELINEFSHGVYNRLLNYILSNNYEEKPLYNKLLKGFKEMLSMDLEFLDAEELERVLSYWKVMDQYIKQII